MSEGINERRLFWASCVALIATAMSFAIRGDIMGDFENVFDLTKTNVGWIAGAAFWGFGLAIFIGGPLCDALGMRLLLWLAAAGHIAGTAMTIFAPNFTILFAATLIIGIANGLVEAVCNPLIASIYPKTKVRKLMLFHAWFPGGIVIGGVAAWLLSQAGMGVGSEAGWKIKMALLFIPSAVYLVMLLGQKFPATERAAAGISFDEMISAAFSRPLFLVLFLCMWLTAATELGPGQWIANIFNDVMSKGREAPANAGILLLVWGNGLMFILRQFVHGPLHKRVSPIALIACTAPIAAAGLWLVTYANNLPMWILATTCIFVGVAFWWPTMLGITNERLPRAGALGLGIIGGTGSISTAVSGPVMGWINDTYGAERVLVVWSALPAVLFVVFGIAWLRDNSKGGYDALVENLSDR